MSLLQRQRLSQCRKDSKLTRNDFVLDAEEFNRLHLSRSNDGHIIHFIGFRTPFTFSFGRGCSYIVNVLSFILDGGFLRVQ